MKTSSSQIAGWILAGLLISTSSFAQDLAELLNEAILFNDPVAVQAALDQGSDPNEAVNNRSPLGWAAQNASVAIVDILIAAGANPNSVDMIGQTPLMRAVESSKKANAKSLIAAGADVNHKTGENRTVAMKAVEAGDVEMVRALLEGGADFDLADDYGDFALMIAVNNQVDQLHEIIAALGAGDVNLDQSNAAYTALLYVVEQGDLSAVESLLAAGANPDAKSDNGAAPLIESLSNKEIFKALLDAGANPNITNKWGETPVFSAIDYGTGDDLRRLLDAGADASHTTEEGQTPLGRANALGKEDMESILREYGAGTPANAEVAETPAQKGDSNLGAHWLATLATLKPIDPPTRWTPSMDYKSSAPVADLLDHYDSELGARGWERGNTQKYENTYALAEYENNSELLSVSLSLNQAESPPETTVSVTPLGNVSTRSLPRYPGVEVQYESALTSMFVTSDNVATVARETKKLLEADGWTGGFEVERDDRFVLEMSRSGTTLNASMGVAAGQGGRTAIQYVVLKENR